MAIGREQRRAREDANRLATVDPLTGLRTRPYLFGALERELARSQRTGRAFCLLMLDLDDLKVINDRLGHLAGDRALRLVGDVVRAGIRRHRHGRAVRRRRVRRAPPRDGPDRRLGPCREDPARRRGGRSRRRRRAGRDERVGGPRERTQDGESLGELLERADEAMYRSKRGGRDRTTGVPVMDEAARHAAGGCARGQPDPLGGRSRQAGVASAGDRRATPSRPFHARDPRRVARAACDPDADDASRSTRPRRSPRATPRSWPRSSPASSPATRTAGSTTRRSSALGDAVAELHDAEAGIALATGMAAIHAAFLSMLRAGERVLIGQVGYGTTRTQAIAAFGRLGVDVGYVDTTDVRRRRGGARARRPTRILHVETIANPTCVIADLPRARRSSRTGTARC